MKLNYFVFALCISVLFSCDPVKPKDCNSCYNNNERPSTALTYQEMASMFEEYDNNQKKVLDENAGGVETISMHYTIEQLKQYIAYIERLSKEKDIPLEGIRIFSAAYPANYKDEKLQKKQTLILSPTTTIKGKKNVAYEPLYSDNGNPVAMQEFLNKFTNENTRKVSRASILPNIFARLSPPQDLESSSANRSNVYPPYHNSGNE
ncbi:hypothetical protein H9I45_12515 [Polaribacter haliotis]|uniref:Lipoprotein n=1 Tax=Polaribacter haliotis TaxID=1888915 RepID=A0A7L8ADT4_9FLAO|nr:hypothetical protein [Polaribacter haliotis]QOD60158.1 hypothetical protein H9I45_12515 [Polaribacter haliotis]